MHNQASSRNKQTITFSKPRKPKLWSHQDDLLQAIGSEIKIVKNSGEVITAVLLAADQFTLKLKLPEQLFATIINKSSLTSFQVLQ